MGKREDMHISETTNAKCGFVITRFLPLVLFKYMS